MSSLGQRSSTSRLSSLFKSHDRDDKNLVKRAKHKSSLADFRSFINQPPLPFRKLQPARSSPALSDDVLSNMTSSPKRRRDRETSGYSTVTISFANASCEELPEIPKLRKSLSYRMDEDGKLFFEKRSTHSKSSLSARIHDYPPEKLEMSGSDGSKLFEEYLQLVNSPDEQLLALYIDSDLGDFLIDFEEEMQLMGEMEVLL